jgi:hypothetical protein
MSKIKLIKPEEIDYLRHQSMLDDARCTGIKLTPRAFHYENTQTGQQYYDLFGCIGWPTEVTDKNDMRPGYTAIVGVVRDQRPAQDAAFQLLAEAESKDIPVLLTLMNELRHEYGFGLHPNLLQPFIGDPSADRFATTIAMVNEKLRERCGHDRMSILIAPPYDFYDMDIFDTYSRAFYSTVAEKETLRFYYGPNEILRNRKREFRRGDPSILAIGGLVHTLINSTPWMDQQGENMFAVEEGI